jgi:hypothetical protein
MKFVARIFEHKKRKCDQEVEGPLKEASDEVERLKKVEEKHLLIKSELEEKQKQIMKLTEDFKREEWEYEVKLQQF